MNWTVRLTAAAFLVAASLPAPAGDFLLQAHRGLCNRYPENTELSFRKAAEVRLYGGMETDVQMTSDGVLVCMHDRTIDRTTDGTGAVSDYTFRQLQQMHIDGGYGWDARYAGRLRVPTFRTYLAICREAGLTPYVELKVLDREGIRKTIEMLHEEGFEGRYVLTSFERDYLLTASEYTDAPLEYMKRRFTPEEVDAWAAAVPHAVVRPEATALTEDLVSYCRSKGLRVECWGIPVGDADLVRRLTAWGVYGGTCNDWSGLGLQHGYPSWLDEAAIYHIYPSSFKDSDGDGYGDLQGIRSKLDYIRELGFNTVWISPVFSAGFEDGGYDIIDYYAIDPRFGTLTDLDDLVRDAHGRGMRICLDLVAGHTSDKHPWFRSSASGTDGKYADWYIWADNGKTPEDGHWVPNLAGRTGAFQANYYDIQPALNFGYYQVSPDHPWEQGYDDPGPTAVREEMKRILAFWFDRGVDGFRCDMAWSLVKGDDAAFHGVRRLWDDIFSWQSGHYPDRIFLSEWSSPVEAVSCGFDIDIIRHNGCGKVMYRDLVYNTERHPDPETGAYPPRDCWLDRAGRGRFDTFAVPFDAMFRALRGKGFACMPTSSHDTWRLNRCTRSTPEELKTALTFFLTMPWVPVLYYGEEIGMRSLDEAPEVEGSRDRSAERTPMQWDDSPNAGFSTCDPGRLYLPVDPSPQRPTVAAQQGDPASVYAYVKGLLALRRSIPALGNTGDWHLVTDPSTAYPVIYERSLDDERYWVLLNPREEPAAVRVKDCPRLEPVWGDPSALTVSRNQVRVAGVSALVCRVL
ncbi:MAG: hypothetical protein IJ721_02020 [Bacteroidales bacterium]|nr:hypothetical protein [Bacteroidales bacterium]